MAYLLQSVAILAFHSKIALTIRSRQCFSIITRSLHSFRSVLQGRCNMLQQYKQPKINNSTSEQ